jgi:VanZ family protein
MIKTLNKYPATWWLIAGGWAYWIFWMSSQSNIPQPNFWLPPFADKIVHAIIYAVLAWSLYPALRLSGVPRWRAAAAAVVLASLYGITDEWHQASVYNRSSDIFDWFADVIGACSVFFLARHEQSIASCIGMNGS